MNIIETRLVHYGRTAQPSAGPRFALCTAGGSTIHDVVVWQLSRARQGRLIARF